MDIENMKAFNKVAELKSISAAANELHHLQSNMSNKIKISKNSSKLNFSSGTRMVWNQLKRAKNLSTIQK